MYREKIDNKVIQPKRGDLLRNKIDTIALQFK